MRIDPDMSLEERENVYRVLAAYCEYNSEIGYVQNMPFLVLLLQNYMTVSQTFFAFVNMMHSDFMQAYINMNVHEIRIRIKNFLVLFSINLPTLSSHFHSLLLPVDTFLMDWVSTLFAKDLPLEVVSRIWDNYFLWGELYIWQAVIGILSILTKQYNLYDKDCGTCLRLLTQIPDNLCEVKSLVQEIEQVKLNKTILRFYWQKQNQDFDLEDFDNKLVDFEDYDRETMASFHFNKRSFW